MNKLYRKLEVVNDKNVMIEGIVQTIVEEKRKHQNKIQENVKLAIQLKELDNKIKELQEELHKQKLLNQLNYSTEDRVKEIILLNDDSLNKVCRVYGLDMDKNSVKGSTTSVNGGDEESIKQMMMNIMGGINAIIYSYTTMSNDNTIRCNTFADDSSYTSSDTSLNESSTTTVVESSGTVFNKVEVKTQKNKK